MRSNVFAGVKITLIGFIFALIFSCGVSAQTTNLPKITQIDDVALKNLLKPNGKPLLVNFWATWCVPCREEFPDLVRISNDYKEKIDVITISLDFAEDFDKKVPIFLSEMKAEMPNYWLVSQDESAIIGSIKKDWTGGLPFTVLYGKNGEMAYFKEGPFKAGVLRGEIDKQLVTEKKVETVVLMDFVKIKNGNRDEAMFYYENNWKVYREIAFKKGFIQSFEIIEVAPNENNQFDLILITRYANEDQYKNSEKNFEPILKETRPNGALLKNDLKPEDFRENVFFKVGKIAFGPNK
jgi:thiol-disulfide isomerase/thioredoxin